MFRDNENICIFGMRGSGKSTLCRQIQEYYENKNIIIFDTLFEYRDSNAHFFTDYPSFAHFVLKNNGLKNQKIVINLPVDENSEVIDDYVKLLYYWGNCTVVIEEVQNFASVHKIPTYLKQASLTGRHKNVNFITTTQRVAEIHKALLSQAHHIFSGFTDSPNDKKTLKEYGFSIQQIEKLNNYEFLWKNERNIYKIDNMFNPL